MLVVFAECWIDTFRASLPIRTSGRFETVAALCENLMCKLIWAVSARQSDEWFAVSVAVDLHITKRMACPADRQQYDRHVFIGDSRGKGLDRCPVICPNPDQFLQSKLVSDGITVMRPLMRPDQYSTSPLKEFADFFDWL